MVLNSTKNFGVEKKLRSLPSRAISTIVSPTKLDNILRGIVPVASGWGTAPTNLEKCTDGDFATVTGTGSKETAGSTTYGTLQFDLGGIKTILIGMRVGVWSTTSGVELFINSSDDNITFTYPYPNITIITSTTERIIDTPTKITRGRYHRIYFNVGAAATAYAKIYQIMAWELKI